MLNAHNSIILKHLCAPTKEKTCEKKKQYEGKPTNVWSFHAHCFSQELLRTVQPILSDTTFTV